MKLCPSCQTEYEDEIIRFCPRDGTPVVDKNNPDFSVQPDFGEETIIRHNRQASQDFKPHIIIPASEPDYSVARYQEPFYTQNGQSSNLTSVILLTIVATVSLLGIGFFAGYLVFSNRSNDKNAVSNTNANQNINVNRAVNGNTNYGFNGSVTNMSINGNLRPSPTKTPIPTPSVTPTPPTPQGNSNNFIIPAPSPFFTPSAKPSASATPTKII